MDMKQAAWQGRRDLVELDWREYCAQHDYPLATVCGAGKNVSHRAPGYLARVGLAVIRGRRPRPALAVIDRPRSCGSRYQRQLRQ